jgi:hypothetical protein
VGARFAGTQLLERLEPDHPELEAPADPALLAQWRSELQNRVVGPWEVESPRLLAWERRRASMPRACSTCSLEAPRSGMKKAPVP